MRGSVFSHRWPGSVTPSCSSWLSDVNPALRRDPPALAGFYRFLLTAVADPTFGAAVAAVRPLRLAGHQQLRQPRPWSWEGDHRWLIVLILSDAPATGRGAGTLAGPPRPPVAADRPHPEPHPGPRR